MTSKVLRSLQRLLGITFATNATPINSSKRPHEAIFGKCFNKDSREMPEMPSSRKVSGLMDPIVDWKKCHFTTKLFLPKMAKFEPWPYCHLMILDENPIKFTESLSSLRHRAPLLPLHPVPCITSPRVSTSIGSCHTGYFLPLEPPTYTPPSSALPPNPRSVVESCQ